MPKPYVAQPQLVGHSGGRSRLVVRPDEARQLQPGTSVGRRSMTISVRESGTVARHLRVRRRRLRAAGRRSASLAVPSRPRVLNGGAGSWTIWAGASLLALVGLTRRPCAALGAALPGSSCRSVLATAGRSISCACYGASWSRRGSDGPRCGCCPTAGGVRPPRWQGWQRSDADHSATPSPTPGPAAPTKQIMTGQAVFALAHDTGSPLRSRRDRGARTPRCQGDEEHNVIDILLLQGLDDPTRRSEGR